MKKKLKKINKDGYTIIETMIAISIFTLIVTLGMGTLLNANLLHHKAQGMRSIMDNLSFTMEDMSRNLRTGYNYRCITGADTLATTYIPKSGYSCWGISFEFQDGKTSDNNDQWVYYINNGKIFKATHGPYTDPSIDPSSGFIQLSPDEVVIDSISGFSVLGAEPVSSGNRQQPFVIIKLLGKITYNGVVTPFSLQTSVSQRLINVGN